LRAQGINVRLRKEIGPTEEIDRELQRSAIDGYPEYLGVAVTVAAHRDDAGSTAVETYALAKRFYAGRDQAISAPTSFENVDAVATTQYFAQQRGLATIGDLRALPEFTLGARPEFEGRQQGLAGMREVYGLDNATFRSIPIGEQYRALDRKIDAADVFSTDGQLASGSYKVFEDTERLFGFQHVALVIDEDKLSKLGGRSFMRIIDDLNGRLTTSVMIQMNRDVEVDGQDPAVVAERFLRTAGLLGREG
jgi:osmoprotectant transport system substrate-binding protein